MSVRFGNCALPPPHTPAPALFLPSMHPCLPVSPLPFSHLSHPPGQVAVRPVRDRGSDEDGRGRGRAPGGGHAAVKPEPHKGGDHGEAGKGEDVGRGQEGLPLAAGRGRDGGGGPGASARAVRGLVRQAAVVVGPAVDGRVEGFLWMGGGQGGRGVMGGLETRGRGHLLVPAPRGARLSRLSPAPGAQPAPSSPTHPGRREWWSTMRCRSRQAARVPRRGRAGRRHNTAPFLFSTICAELVFRHAACTPTHTLPLPPPSTHTRTCATS